MVPTRRSDSTRDAVDTIVFVFVWLCMFVASVIAIQPKNTCLELSLVKFYVAPALGVCAVWVCVRGRVYPRVPATRSISRYSV